MSTTLNTAEKSRIGVSEHAKLRYRQRVDAGEPFVCDAVRRLFVDADRTHRPEIDGLAWDAGDITLVTDHKATTVITVVRRRGRA